MSTNLGDGLGPATIDPDPTTQGSATGIARPRAQNVPPPPPPLPPPDAAGAGPEPDALHPDAGGEPGEQVAGIPVLKGLILYTAVLAFAALYTYFIVEIFAARAGSPPSFNATLVDAAAALAGVLGSAFALAVGVTTDTSETNTALHAALTARQPSRKQKAATRLRSLLSITPSNAQAVSWPKTLGIWAYALVGSAVAITYVTHQNETPSSIKALAVAFGGYVIALVTTAYGIKAKSTRGS
jgi:hypothetical protein